MITSRDDVVVRVMPLPDHVHGFVYPSSDGCYNVYINDNLSPRSQFQTLLHEIQHIENGDFHNGKTVEDVEGENEGQ